MTREATSIFSACCPSRPIIDQIANKWSMLVLTALRDEPHRSNAICRRLEGITHEALTRTLRRLERNGHVIPSLPIVVNRRGNGDRDQD